MKSVLYIIAMGGLWIANLFNGTGLGAVYQTTEKLRVIIFLLFSVIFLKSCKRKGYYIKKREFLILGGMSCLFIFSSYMQGYGMMGLHYLSVFALVYILGKVKVTEMAVKLTGFLYLVLGIAILYLYDYGTVLSGWNPNTIGMIGLYSYLIFMIPYYNSKNKVSSKIILITVTLLYMVLIEPTDSRSCTWFSAVAVLFALSIIPKTIIIKRDKKYFWLLLIPLFVAIATVVISKGSYMEILNLWSIKNFQKPIFNGRDALWDEGFQIMFQNLIFGRGSLDGNWHNCLIGVLTAYGVTGGVLWILSLQNIIEKGRDWLNDAIVAGCVISFFLMYIQQSVELGFVYESPNLLPYIVLGMMSGRVNFLIKKSV